MECRCPRPVPDRLRQLDVVPRCRAFDAGVAVWWANGATPLLNETATGAAPRPALGQVDATAFIDRTALQDEVFGNRRKCWTIQRKFIR